MHQKLIHQNVFNYLVRVVNQKFSPKRKWKIQNEDVVFQALRVLRYVIMRSTRYTVTDHLRWPIVAIQKVCLM